MATSSGLAEDKINGFVVAGSAKDTMVGVVDSGVN